MMNSRQTYRRPREPEELGRSYTPDRRWNWRPPLLEGSLLARRLFGGTLGQQRMWSPPLGKPPTGFSIPDVGRPPNVECDIGLLLGTFVSSELETTRLTEGSECCQVFFIRHASSLGGPPDRNKSGICARTPVQTSAGNKVPTLRKVKYDYCLTIDRKRFQLCQN
jgi:hypothetical protein